MGVWIVSELKASGPLQRFPGERRVVLTGFGKDYLSEFMSGKALGALTGSQVFARVLVLNVMDSKIVCASRESSNLMTKQ